MSRARWATILLGVYFGCCLLLFTGLTAAGLSTPHVSRLAVLALAFLAAPVALALVWHLPRHPVTLVLAVYVAAQLTAVGPGLMLNEVTAAAAGGWDVAVVDRLNGLLWLASLPLLPLLMTVVPEPPRRGLAVWLLRAEFLAVGVLAIVVLVDDSRDGLSPITAGMAAAAGVLLVVTGTAAAGRLVYRARCDQRIRAQLSPVAWAAALVAAVYVLFAPLAAVSPAVRQLLGGPVGYAALVSALPAGVGYAILRHRLFGVHLVLARALTAAVTAVLLAGLYFTTVVLAARVLEVPNGSLAILVAAAGLVAFVLAPCYALVQRRVSLLLYGRRGDPLGVIKDLGKQLALSAPDEVADQIVVAVRDALKLPWVALDSEEDGGAGRVAQVGVLRSDSALESLPLAHAGAVCGWLRVQPRAGEAALGRLDRRLLQYVGDQAGPAVAANRYVTELALSRERLVLAREQERDRLRRDLHDGLSPALAGISLALDAARQLLHTDQATADQLLERAQSEAATSWADVRRILDDLGPPGLEELGLVGALELRARALTRAGCFYVSVTAPRLPPLPAAIETAAYRIAVEGMTNAARHAGASRCSVCVEAHGLLQITVEDDGHGVAGTAPGVGIASMQARAAELGGVMSLCSTPGGGTRLAVNLPLSSRA
ncbi:MAG: sensor histidine kinase [Actinomycetota bacterium]|nr:sensor histidine kinase [Actinomycetota bacterium]